MAERIADILARLNLPSAVEPEPPARVSPGCEPWCRGEGARRLAAPPWPATSQPTYLETVRNIPYEYCPCPAGAGARERHMDALAALEAAAAQRAVDRLWDASEIPTKFRRYSLESYLALPESAPVLVEKLRRWQSLARTSGRSLILRGNPGTRKTGLSIALLAEQLAAGRSGLYLQADRFLTRVRMTNQTGVSSDDNSANEAQMLAAASCVGLLVLDDVGTMTDWARKVLLQLVDERVSWERPTIVVPNLDRAELEHELGKRTFDRLRESAQPTPADESFLVYLAGESRRGLAVVSTPGSLA